MENGHMSELSQKKIPRSVVSKNLNFFNFLKSFPRWSSSAVGENFNFFDFFEKFSKMKKILMFSLQDNYNI